MFQSFTRKHLILQTAPVSWLISVAKMVPTLEEFCSIWHSFKKQNQTSHIITFQVKLDWGTHGLSGRTLSLLCLGVLEYEGANSCLKNYKYCNEVTNKRRSFTYIIQAGTVSLTRIARALYWTPSWVTSVQSTTWHPILLISGLISPVYLLLGLTSGLVAAGSPHMKYAQHILPSWSRSL